MTKRQKQCITCALNRMQRSDSPHSSCTSLNQPRISFSSRDQNKNLGFQNGHVCVNLILAVANCNVVDGKFSGDVTLQSCKRIHTSKKNTIFYLNSIFPCTLQFMWEGQRLFERFLTGPWMTSILDPPPTTHPTPTPPPPSCWNTTLCPSYIGLPLGNSEERRRSGNLIDEGTQVSHFDGFSNSKNQMPWQERKCLCDCFPGGCEGNPWISDNGRR